MMKISRYIVLAGILLISACQNKKNALDVPGYELSPGTIEISKEAMEDIIQNISSPIEIAALIKTMGLPYSHNSLINLEHIDSYTSSFKMAYTLGMLAADLGYLNVFEKTGNSVSYLTAINRIADGLKVAQFFDFSTIKRLATSNASIDSLIYLSVHSFNQMDDYLRETDRSNLSALMVTGVWIEGMCQLSSVLENHNIEELIDYIGEQKLILNDLILILKNYENDDQFALLVEDYEELKKTFGKVRISYEISDPEPVEQEDGSLLIVQNETSIVEVDDIVLKEIIDKIKSIRDNHLLM